VACTKAPPVGTHEPGGKLQAHRLSESVPRPRDGNPESRQGERTRAMLLKHTIVWAAAAGLVFALAPAAQAALMGELGILDLTANGGINPATGAPWALGDQYRFAFHTSEKTTAVSADITTYNAWVQGLADAAGLGAATWKAIGSTDTVDARDNTSTNPTVDGSGHAIFLLDGSTVVANDYNDLWDGDVDHIIDRTELGTTWAHWPYTGTYKDGTKAPGHPSSFGALGAAAGDVHQGQAGVATNWIWRMWTGDPPTTLLPMYALSEPLEVVPDPATLALLSIGGLGLLIRRGRVRG